MKSLKRIAPSFGAGTLNSLWIACGLVRSSIGALRQLIRNLGVDEIYFDDFCVTKTGIRMGKPRVLAGETIPSDAVLVMLEDGRFFFFRGEDISRFEAMEGQP